MFTHDEIERIETAFKPIQKKDGIQQAFDQLRNWSDPRRSRPAGQQPSLLSENSLENLSLAVGLIEFLAARVARLEQLAMDQNADKQDAGKPKAGKTKAGKQVDEQVTDKQSDSELLLADDGLFPDDPEKAKKAEKPAA